METYCNVNSTLCLHIGDKTVTEIELYSSFIVLKYLVEFWGKLLGHDLFYVHMV